MLSQRTGKNLKAIGKLNHLRRSLRSATILRNRLSREHVSGDSVRRQHRRGNRYPIRRKAVRQDRATHSRGRRFSRRWPAFLRLSVRDQSAVQTGKRTAAVTRAR